MKKLENLNGAKALNKNEQKEILGGAPSLSCGGKNAGDSCGTSSNPTAICCYNHDFRYLYCALPQICGPYGSFNQQDC